MREMREHRLRCGGFAFAVSWRVWIFTISRVETSLEKN